MTAPTTPVPWDEARLAAHEETLRGWLEEGVPGPWADALECAAALRSAKGTVDGRLDQLRVARPEGPHEDEEYAERLRAAWAALDGPASIYLEFKSGRRSRGYPWFGVSDGNPATLDIGPEQYAREHQDVALSSNIVSCLILPDPVVLPPGHGLIAEISTQHLEWRKAWRVLNALYEAVPAGSWVTIYGSASGPSRGPWLGPGTFGQAGEPGIRFNPLPGRRDGKVSVVTLALREIRHLLVTMPPPDERPASQPV